jgi:hypothetical protein
MLGIEDYGDSDSDSEPSLSGTSKQTTVVIPKSTKTQRGPKKITIPLPPISNAHDDIHEAEDERPPKKRKTGGAKSSSLISMLPIPKQGNPMAQTRDGGTEPGLNFRDSTSTLRIPLSVDEEAAPLGYPHLTPAATLFHPTSVSKGRKNISLEETNIKPVSATPEQVISPPVDFFSLSGCHHTF